jgi:hypothetical protein
MVASRLRASVRLIPALSRSFCQVWRLGTCGKMRSVGPSFTVRRWSIRSATISAFSTTRWRFLFLAHDGSVYMAGGSPCRSISRQRIFAASAARSPVLHMKA